MTGFININKAVYNYQGFLTILIRCLGQIGNCIFICCSAWFLVDSKKINVKKVINIIVNVFIVSVIIMILCIIGGINLSFKEIIKCILPTSFNNNWFIGCYILYYIIHQPLNKFIECLNKKQLLRVNMFLIIYFCVWQLIFRKIYSSIMGFIVLHFIVAYIKKYMPNYTKNIKLNICALIISIIGFIFSMAIFNILCLKVSAFDKDIMLYIADIINPFLIIASISILNLFINRNFINKIINYIASLTLLIYIIHDNVLLRNYVRSWYYSKIYLTYGYNHINLIIIFTAIGMMVASIILASIYKETIQKIVRKICDYLYPYIKTYILKIENLLIRIN